MTHIMHYGTKRHSGRYPWGSGDDPYQRTSRFLEKVENLKKQGFTEKEIASHFGMSQQQLRAKKTFELSQEHAANLSYIHRLKEKGYSNSAIASKMGKNESYIRSILKTSEISVKKDVEKVKSTLENLVAETGYLDVGAGAELYLNGGVSREKMKSALLRLKEEGYVVQEINIPQPGNPGQFTTTKVLALPGATTREIWSNKSKINSVASVQANFDIEHPNAIKKPVSVSSKRVSVLYAGEGGDEQDGLIEIRPNAKDLNMGGARYAQVRIAVDNTHYIKGMAVYSDNLPPGVDIRISTNKKKGTPLKSSSGDQVLKKMTDDELNPFETNIRRQLMYTDKNGERKQSALNIVYSEGDWDTWKPSLSSQFLSKQRPALAARQLGLSLAKAKAELEDIKKLTNPVVKKRLLISAADGFDADAAHLEAASLPRQNWRVILPIRGLKNTEVYAPDYKDGEKVVLIRYPHAGVFEIPELVVNNRNKVAKAMFGANPKDAIGISSKVAEKLSGADFDGDTVLIIPNKNGDIRHSPSLRKLKDFDPKKSYPYHDGMTPLTSKKREQTLMGDVSNLITDMTLMGAPPDDIARAVRHSMVVIDAKKHKLNYKQSYEDNGIAALKKKYQGSARAGASTLISKSNSDIRVPEKRLRKSSEGGYIDPKTGKKIFVETGRENKVTISKRMLETDDAYSLSSGTRMESVYAEYANSMKALANSARKEYISTKNYTYSPEAKIRYISEVNRLNSALNIALRNAPLERKALILADDRIKTIKSASPDLGDDKLKKIRARELAYARAVVGAKRHQIVISDKEWEAIQAGAVSPTKLDKILANTDLDLVKTLSMPKERRGLTPEKQSRAKTLLAMGYTRAEVAEAIGVSPSTLNRFEEET